MTADEKYDCNITRRRSETSLKSHHEKKEAATVRRQQGGGEGKGDTNEVEALVLHELLQVGALDGLLQTCTIKTKI